MVSIAVACRSWWSPSHPLATLGKWQSPSIAGAGADTKTPGRCWRCRPDVAASPERTRAGRGAGSRSLARRRTGRAYWLKVSRALPACLVAASRTLEALGLRAASP
eukprot:4627659-Prymnesium_polylepis.1